MRISSHLKIALAAVVLASGSAALAHGSMRPQHGGLVAMSGEIVVELVRGPNGVSVYVTEEDEPLPASGMTGKLTVSAGGKKADTPLVAGPGNRFDARGLRVPAGAAVTVALVNTASRARTFVNFTVR